MDIRDDVFKSNNLEDRYIIFMQPDFLMDISIVKFELKETNMKFRNRKKNLL